MNKLIITSFDDRLVSVEIEDGVPVAIYPEPLADGPKLGSIYVGKVKNILPNINSAFVEIAPGENCFLSLKNLGTPIYVKKSKAMELKIGDELLVQVSKEAMKTKLPSVTTDLNISGQYFVFTLGNKQISYSKKYTTSERTLMMAYIKEKTLPESYGVVCRTSAVKVNKDVRDLEWNRLVQQMDQLVYHGRQRTCHSQLYQKSSVYMQKATSLLGNQVAQIVTDKADVYEYLINELGHRCCDQITITHYTDDYSLANLYGFIKLKDQLLNRKIWLKSGGYLVFDYTEACIVIDVNSGKNIRGNNKRTLINEINGEAAHMIARHLRLRNLSGICIIDFIDMKDENDKLALMNTLKRAVAKDPIPTQVVDLTKLNLVEVTRKKINQPLHEIFHQNY